MFGKTATVTLALLFLSVFAPALSHGLEEDRAEPIKKEASRDNSEAHPDLALSRENLTKNQSLILKTSTEPVKEQQLTNSFLQDQLEQKSPVYLWVPGRGAVGVGVTMSW